jgi:4-amino-4-deoxy-L-arabinose transferase-like glycosyltransferase
LIGAEIFPDRLHIALGGAAFVALVPQHVAMLAAVNSDALAELLIALCVYQALQLFRSPQPSQRALLSLGVTLGLGLLTKSTVYYTALPIVTAALILHTRRHVSRITQYALVFVPAFTLGALFWLRNLGIYGGLDILGLARHNAIVVGQTTTVEWITKYGFGGLLSEGLMKTFHSFWGQFGWMAVPMPDSTYLILGALSALALVGWGWWLIERCRRQEARGKRQDAGCIGPHGSLLTLLVVLTLGGFIYYNLTFVQHQGRYLFPALIPIGLGFTLGIDQWLSKIKAALVKLTAQSKRDLTPWLNEAQLLALALIFVFLARLCVIALQRYIIPYLSA